MVSFLLGFQPFKEHQLRLCAFHRYYEPSILINTKTNLRIYINPSILRLELFLSPAIQLRNSDTPMVSSGKLEGVPYTDHPAAYVVQHVSDMVVN